MPAAAILLADFVLRREQEGDKPNVWLTTLHAILCAALMVAALIIPFRLVHQEMTKPAIIVAITLAVITDSDRLVQPAYRRAIACCASPRWCRC